MLSDEPSMQSNKPQVLLDLDLPVLAALQSVDQDQLASVDACCLNGEKCWECSGNFL